MRCFLFLVLLSLAKPGNTQSRFVNLSNIDWEVRFVDASTPDSLAQKLTSSYRTDLEKVRAIFSWTTQNIAYNTGIFNSPKRNASSKYAVDYFDTAMIWKTGIEMTAMKVLRKRTAVCDGYAKLFKTLCDYAGIQAEIITGYAKGYVEKNERFRTNHSWNAVMIDGTWRLVDVTWASGFVTYSNEFVQRTDERYFLPPPEQFIQDHYPDDLRWTLLERPPSLREFHFSPYKCKSFVKYGLQLFSHSKGTIDAIVGDTVWIRLLAKDPKRDIAISSDPFFDSATVFHSPASAFLEPVMEGNKAVYRYIVQSDEAEWLHLFYNGDIVLRYRLNVKKPVILSN